MKPVKRGLLVLTLPAAAALAQGPAAEPAASSATSARRPAITFQHHSAPGEEVHRRVDERRRRRLRLRQRRARRTSTSSNSLTVDTANDPKAARSALYRNLGGNRFEDVTDKAGVGHPGWGMGLCTADVDGDGYEDIYVTNLGPQQALPQQPRRHVHRHRPRGGRDAPRRGPPAARFGDYDRDGDLDLFVSRYVKLDLAHLPEFGKGKTCEYRGVAVQCGPRGLPGEGDLLFRNEGNGQVQRGGRSGRRARPARALRPRRRLVRRQPATAGPTSTWPTTRTPNFLYMNQKDGTFKETAFAAGVAVSEDGAEQGIMGVAVGDYDNSGRLSLFVTNFSEEYNALYHNDGALLHRLLVPLEDRAASSLPYVGWGTELPRLRQRRLAGHHRGERPRLPAARPGAARRLGALPAAAAAVPQPRRRHLRGGGGAATAHVLTEPRVSRGPGDDRPRRRRPRRPRAERPRRLPAGAAERARAGRPLAVGQARGQGPEHERHRRGRVASRRARSRCSALVRSGSSYISQDDKRQHFGLGAAAQAEWVEVLWPDQTKTRVENVAADQVLRIRQP